MVRNYFILILLFCINSSWSLAAGINSNFMWGVGNAAFQVEGSPLDSDWLRFTKNSGNIKDGTNADVATDFWNRYEEDFKLAQDLGANTFRISIAWERIQPSENKWDEVALLRYEKMLMSMRSHGLEPVVTLQHFVLPGWLVDKGGLLAPEFPQLFSQYALKVMHHLSPAPAKVKYWMTFNEPEILVFCGYFWSCWPPKLFLNMDKATAASANIARAHIKTINLVRSSPQLSQVFVSVAKHWAVVQPKTNSLRDREAARDYDDMFNRQFMDAFLYGKIRFSMPGANPIIENHSIVGNRPGLDYIGINYYQRSIVNKLWVFPYYNSVTGPGPKNDLGWEIYPQGMLDLLRDVARYKLPILVSENGVADKDDQKRSQFLIKHIEALLQAKHEQVPVFGYLHWSLTDNFEWAEGLSPRFGLVEIDYKTLERKPRPSFFVFQNIIKNNK